MNREYYYLDGNEQRGPLGIDQLKSVGLKPETLVWTEGLKDWKPVKEVDELKILLKTPPIPPPASVSSVPKRSSVEVEYEKAIALYLEHGYEIVNQSAESTILLSSNFRKDATANAFFRGMTDGTVGSIQSSSIQNTRISQYQVTIRITKTGDLQITGYTLDKHGKGTKSRKWGLGCLITIIVIVLLFLIVLAIGGAL